MPSVRLVSGVMEIDTLPPMTSMRLPLLPTKMPLFIVAPSAAKILMCVGSVPSSSESSIPVTVMVVAPESSFMAVVV